MNKKPIGANQPKLMQDIRKELIANQLVQQILDPWYMDINTHDKTPSVENKQKGPIEKLRANHLPITISEPWII
ncbi:hypothetical protein GTP38_00655 [Duganella sp. FT94W]|uniref:Uncharacterized protein n=2 Tax=Duganella lactea TaxID=2692173 RepID=A0ABW9V1W7_9BURK|nr:hypothetical protein [Duganella lactea]